MKSVIIKVAAVILFAAIGVSCVGRLATYLDLHLIPESEYAVLAGDEGLMWIFTAPLGCILGAITGFALASCYLREFDKARLSCIFGGVLMTVLLSLSGIHSVSQQINWPTEGSGECVDIQQFIAIEGFALLWSISLMICGIALQSITSRQQSESA